MEMRGKLGRYRLRPHTGKRHQLRVHMAALGLPILGDRIYPDLLPQGGDRVDNPLRLLAQSIAFRDPVTGENRSFASRQQLHFPVSSLD
jgi:tRNA pseudouridine32 synthase/23S rRNA pseudouridine746 synthase